MKVMRFLCFFLTVAIFAGFVVLLATLGGCGDHVVEKYKDTPQPTPTPTVTPTPGTGVKPTFAEMQALMKEYCSACHSTAQFYTGSEAVLRASRAKDYLWSRRMPPANAPKALPDAVRNQMVNFF